MFSCIQRTGQLRSISRGHTLNVIFETEWTTGERGRVSGSLARTRASCHGRNKCSQCSTSERRRRRRRGGLTLPHQFRLPLFETLFQKGEHLICSFSSCKRAENCERDNHFPAASDVIMSKKRRTTALRNTQCFNDQRLPR